MAVSQGDTSLASAIQTQLTAVGGQITAANNTLTQLQTITSTGTASVVSGLSGVKASADQIAQATANAQTAVDNLKGQLADLNQQLIVADAAGNQTLVDAINTQIAATNSQLTTANSTLSAIQAATAGAAATVPGWVPGTQATPEQLATAIQNLQQTISDLKGQAADLNQQIIVAQSENNQALVTSLNTQLSTVNGTISTDNAELSTLMGENTGAVTLGAADVAGAIANEKTTIDGLTTKLADLNTQLIAATNAGSTDLVNIIQSEISSTNTDLTNANTTLSALEGLTAQGTAATQQLTAVQQKAIDNATADLNQLKGQLAIDQGNLITAEAAHNTTLVTSIKSQMDTLNTQISAAQTTLDDINAGVLATAKNTTPTPTPSGTGSGTGTGTLPSSGGAEESWQQFIEAFDAASTAQQASINATISQQTGGSVTTADQLNIAIGNALNVGNTQLATQLLGIRDMVTAQLVPQQQTAGSTANLVVLNTNARLAEAAYQASQTTYQQAQMDVLAAQVKALDGTAASASALATAQGAAKADYQQMIDAQKAANTAIGNLATVTGETPAQTAIEIDAALKAQAPPTATPPPSTLPATPTPPSVPPPPDTTALLGQVTDLGAKVSQDLKDLGTALLTGNWASVTSLQTQLQTDLGSLTKAQETASSAGVKNLGDLASMLTQVETDANQLGVFLKTGDTDNATRMQAQLATDQKTLDAALQTANNVSANTAAMPGIGGNIRQGTDRTTDATTAGSHAVQGSIDTSNTTATQIVTAAQQNAAAATAQATAVGDLQKQLLADQAALVSAIASSNATQIAQAQQQLTTDQASLAQAQQTAQASQNQVTVIQSLQDKIASDNQALIAAQANGNTDLVTQLQNKLQADTDALTAAQSTATTTQTSNLQTLQDKQAADAQALVAAIASGDAAQVAQAQQQLSVDTASLAQAQQTTTAAQQNATAATAQATAVGALQQQILKDQADLVTAIATGNQSLIAQAQQQLTTDQATLDQAQQTTTATQATTTATQDLQTKIALDNQDLIAAEASGNTDLITKLQAQLQSDTAALTQSQVDATTAQASNLQDLQDKLTTDTQALATALLNGDWASVATLTQQVADDTTALTTAQGQTTDAVNTTATTTQAAVTTGATTVGTSVQNTMAPVVSALSAIQIATGSWVDLELIRQGIINLNLSLQTVYGDIEGLKPDLDTMAANSTTALGRLAADGQVLLNIDKDLNDGPAVVALQSTAASLLLLATGAKDLPATLALVLTDLPTLMDDVGLVLTGLADINLSVQQAYKDVEAFTAQDATESADLLKELKGGAIVTAIGDVDKQAIAIDASVGTLQTAMLAKFDSSVTTLTTDLINLGTNVATDLTNLGTKITSDLTSLQSNLDGALTSLGSTISGAIGAAATAAAASAKDIKSSTDKATAQVATSGDKITGQVATSGTADANATAAVPPPIVGALGSVSADITSGLSGVAGAIVTGDSIIQAALASGQTPPGTMPGETYGSSGQIIPPSYYFDPAQIANRTSSSDAMQTALQTGDWAAFQAAMQTFQSNSGGSAPAWLDTVINNLAPGETLQQGVSSNAGHYGSNPDVNNPPPASPPVPPNSSQIPQYQTGGYVISGGLAILDTGETVVPPGGVASTPSSGGSNVSAFQPGLQQIVLAIQDGATKITGALTPAVAQKPLSTTATAAPPATGSSSTIPSFDLGGYVNQDMLAYLHGGEFVVPPNMVSSGVANAGISTADVQATLAQALKLGDVAAATWAQQFLSSMQVAASQVPAGPTYPIISPPITPLGSAPLAPAQPLLATATLDTVNASVISLTSQSHSDLSSLRAAMNLGTYGGGSLTGALPPGAVPTVNVNVQVSGVLDPTTVTNLTKQLTSAFVTALPRLGSASSAGRAS